ncbi:MAG: 3-deoxy-D-manno-octulosonic acid transferase [Candidatus Hydrogenedens sp.]|nr:3-deoxy-D-manno-octulosonic acid transferase [Candidatus Hydrogenedens sp.]
MVRTLYNLAWRAAVPAGRWASRTRPKVDAVLHRLDPALPHAQAPGALWVHACSVGEVNTVRPFLPQLSRATGGPWLLSASTPTGLERARGLYPDQAFACPLDHPTAVRRLLDRMQPTALILTETELWPNLVLETAARSIPVLIINGRLSERHFARFHRYRWLARPMFQALSGVGAQDELHAERYLALGVRPGRVEVTGNLKFDAAPTEVETMGRDRLRAKLGIPRDAPVLIFGSTRPGDEALASACWMTLREELPDLRLIIAPRHLERADEVIKHFSEPVARRSAIISGNAPAGARVILLDTLGELVPFYALSTLAVIGGSLYPGVAGHNPLEPAGLGVPVVFGPYMQNFEQPARVLESGGAATRVACPEDLYAALSDALRNPGELRRRGTLARRIVLDHQGVAARTADWVSNRLNNRA